MPAGRGPDSINIRSVLPDDTEALRDLRLEALRLCPAAFGADLAVNEARPMDFWREQCATNGVDGASAILLATGGDELLGMAGVWATNEPKLAHRAMIWGVYVRAHARGRGIGAGLVDAALDWAAAKGKLIVDLAVIVGNETARRCYERAGFTVYGVQPMVVRVDGVFYDELLMAKRLEPRPTGQGEG